MPFCSVETSAEYQLKPQRGSKTQTAFVDISDIIVPDSDDQPPVFVVDSLTKIPNDEAETVPEQMRRCMQLAALAAKQQGKDKVAGWIDELNPATAAKCRKLSRAPTNDPPDQYPIQNPWR